MNTRDIGKKLESFVADYLKSIDKKARPSKNSGASTEIGDILNTEYSVECKKRNTENITVKSKIWNKLCSDIPVSSLKTPLYILQNSKNETFAVLDLKDFIRLAEFYYKNNI